ncbi:MAG: glycoside hydrolase family 43 protein [Lachnospiraceae bacterium]|nr:glycoside hydrolase family 43 protein [Lachnospiraceae bacterium]
MLNRKWKKTAAGFLAAALCLAGCGGAAGSAPADNELAAEDIKKGNYGNGISCHDPQIILADGTYYMTGSHIVLAESKDMDQWEYISNGSAAKYISNLYSGDLPAFSYVGKNEDGGYSVWAANIFYNETMGKYCMYFCTSSSYIKSALALAVSDVPEGPYTYVDTLLCSGFSASEVDKTNLLEVLGADADIDRYFKYGGYDNTEWPNCIDPAIFTDDEGKIWMVYGSWSGGLFLLEIDPASGYPIFPEADEANGVDPYFGYHLIGGGHHACEGPFIFHNEDNGYYYLFVSCGGLTRTGGYQMRLYRSENPTGPYVDASGKTWDDEEDFFSYGLKMMGNYSLPSLETAYMAPGGQSVFVGADGNTYLVYHQRFDNGSEYHEPRVHRLYLNDEGWYMAAPFETGSESTAEEGYTAAELAGSFYILDHELDISDVIHEGKACSFKDGKISGEYEGTYELTDGTDSIHVTIDGTDYSGKLINMTDEAGNATLSFMAVGGNNHTLWGIKYLAS